MRFLSSTDKFDDRIKGLSDCCSWSQMMRLCSLAAEIAGLVFIFKFDHCRMKHIVEDRSVHTFRIKVGRSILFSRAKSIES